MNAHANPALVVHQIIDSIRNCFAQLLIQKVVHLDLFRLALGLPLTSSILEPTYQFFFLGVDRNDRLSALLKLFYCEINELRINNAMV